jgi:purine nucleoside permease
LEPAGAQDSQPRARWIHRTRLEAKIIAPAKRARLFGEGGACYAACADGAVLRILAAATEDGPVDLARLARELQARPATLG